MVFLRSVSMLVASCPCSLPQEPVIKRVQYCLEDLVVDPPAGMAEKLNWDQVVRFVHCSNARSQSGPILKMSRRVLSGCLSLRPISVPAQILLLHSMLEHHPDCMTLEVNQPGAGSDDSMDMSTSAAARDPDSDKWLNNVAFEEQWQSKMLAHIGMLVRKHMYLLIRRLSKMDVSEVSSKLQIFGRKRAPLK